MNALNPLTKWYTIIVALIVAALCVIQNFMETETLWQYSNYLVAIGMVLGLIRTVPPVISGSGDASANSSLVGLLFGAVIFVQAWLHKETGGPDITWAWWFVDAVVVVTLLNVGLNIGDSDEAEG